MFVTPIRFCGPWKQMNSVLANNNNVPLVIAGITRNYAKGKDKGDCCKNIDQTKGKKVVDWPSGDPPPQPWVSSCPQGPAPTSFDPYRIKVPDVVVPPLPPSNAKPMLDCAKTGGHCSKKAPPSFPPCKPPPPPPFNWMPIIITGGFFTLMGLIYKIYLYYLSTLSSDDNKIIWRPRRRIKRPFHEKDLPACVQYLIVGTGAAGWAAYRAIMQHDKTAKVFFITKEDTLPYRRPPMSKHMLWNEEPPNLMTLSYIEEMRVLSMYYARCKDFMDPVKFYRKKKGPAVSIATGWCVIRIDPDAHAVYVQTVCGEQPIYYERLLLAPGSKAKNLNLVKSAPKAVRDKIQTLRTIRDLEKIYRRVREAKDVVILGGGLLGTELAWHLGKMNDKIEREPEEPRINFTHIYKDRGVLGNLLPDYLGEWAAEHVKCANVTVMPQTMIWDAFETPDGRVELTLSNGKSMITDYVVVAIGAKPRDELGLVSNLELDSLNGGYKVNTELVARKHLWVAGDAASLFSQWKDARVRMEHYINAVEQGTVAGGNMTGFWTPANLEPHFELNLGHELSMEVIGEIGACMPTIAIFKQCEEDALKKMEKENNDPKVVEKRKAIAEERLRDNENRKKRNWPLLHEEDCFKKDTQEEHVKFEWRYKRGIIFYLRDEVVVGMLFWNIPPIEHRKEVVTELLRARPSYKDVNLLADLVGFPQTVCIPTQAEEIIVPPVCFDAAKIRHL